MALVALFAVSCASSATSRQEAQSALGTAPRQAEKEKLQVEKEALRQAQERLAKEVKAAQKVQSLVREQFALLSPESAESLDLAVKLAMKNENYGAAIDIANAAASLYPEELQWYEAAIDARIGAQDYRTAREDARALMRKEQDVGMRAFWRAFEADPSYSPTRVDTIEPQGNNVISALGGGSTVTFKYKVDGTNVAALKPDQDLRQSMYRSEIAFYRICEILGCSFVVPENYPVRISKGDFTRLYDTSTAKSRGYRQKFVHLLWKREDGKDYLYATHKEWVPNFVFFPIEKTQSWRPYLNFPVREAPSITRFMDSLRGADRVNRRQQERKFDEFTENISSMQLLQQISDIILIDFLSNNWDRFSGDPDNFGANCHLQNGGIVAIDNGAAFPPWHTPRVQRRLHMVQRFSKALVENLRHFDPDEILNHLFPNPTREELKAFALFKERRKQALDYIDSLIQKYGEADVLVF